MDIITQGIAGAVLAQTGAGRQKGMATVVGFAAGLLPDADVLIRSADDPLLALEFHRQFSHSLLFIPVGGLIAALLLWPFVRRHSGFVRLYLYALSGYSAGGILDACTSFGTQLLWPFSDARIAWSLVPVIDPLLSLSLLALLVAGWRRRQHLYPVTAIGFALAYLSLAHAQQQASYAVQQQLAEARGHIIEQSVVKPTLGNIVLWRSVYRYGDRYHVDAIRVGLDGSIRVFEGQSVARYRPDVSGHTRLSQQSVDIARFNKLSQGYLVRHPDEEHVIGDIRYAMLPDSVSPLWGIRLDSGSPDSHVDEVTFRKTDAETRRLFFGMLLGKQSVHSQN